MSGITNTTHRGRDICALYWLQKAIKSRDQLDETIILVGGYVMYAKVLIRVAMEQLGPTSITGMCPIARAYSSTRDAVDVLQEDNIDKGRVMLTMERIAKQMGCAQCGRGRSDSPDDDDSSNKNKHDKLTRCRTSKIM